MMSKQVEEEKVTSGAENETHNILSAEKQNKLLKLLGGKKASNTAAASAWINKSRSSEEEADLEKGLEDQYNVSLNLRLSGKARRHEGIGFEENKIDDSNTSRSLQMSDHCDKDIKSRDLNENSSCSRRSRSRSPIRKEKNVTDVPSKRNVEDKNDSKISDLKSMPKTTKNISKANFYMQFTKAKHNN